MCKGTVCQELPDAFVSASHELSQEYREIPARLDSGRECLCRPCAAEYLAQLNGISRSRASTAISFVVQSTGGLFPINHARRDCVRMLESGAAAGVIGARKPFARNWVSKTRSHSIWAGPRRKPARLAIAGRSRPAVP